MRGFSWRDIVTTLLAVAGGVIVYAKLQDYGWWLVSSWRGVVAALGVIGIAMCITAGGDLDNRSTLNRLEAILGMLSFGLIVVGLIFSSQFISLILATVLGALWLVSTARHIRRSLIHESHSGATHRPAVVH